MGYHNPKWSSGYIIGKESNSAPLYWHTDWWAWDDPISFVKKPPMIFVMFYLIKFEVEILLHYWHLIIVYLILKLDMPYPA